MCLGLMVQISYQQYFLLFGVVTKLIQNAQKPVQVLHMKTEQLNELAVIYCTV